MSQNDHWMQRDLDVLWHPCTQMKDHERLPLIPIRRGKGVWLEDFDGKRYLDAVSSWWVNILGHANPYINDRIKQRLNALILESCPTSHRMNLTGNCSLAKSGPYPFFWNILLF